MFQLSIVELIFSKFPASGTKGKVQRKPKAQKKREERERTKGKTQGEELKEDNDDSSSTTTETSNPDMEASLKGVQTDPAFSFLLYFFWRLLKAYTCARCVIVV